MPDKRITVWVQQFKDRPALVLQWIDPDTGRRKSQSAKTSDPDEAEDARVDLEADLNNGRYQEASRMSWDRFRELFTEEYLPNCRKKTRARYDDVFNLFEELCRPQRLKSISERTVSTFTAEMRKRPCRGRIGMAPSTIRVHLQFLHTSLNWAVEQKMLPRCPNFPTVKVPRKKPQPVPTESFERLVAKAADEQTKAFLLTGWLAGLRLSETCALEWEPTDTAPYVDLLRERIVLPAEFAKAVEDQWVPLDPTLRQMLEALPRHGKRVFRFLARDGHELTTNGVSERVIRLAKKAGVKLSMHTLRKGFGCYYAGKVSAHVLQKLMRHANITTTMAYYANVDAAVEAAVFTRHCNSSRNSERAPAEAQESSSDASPYQS